ALPICFGRRSAGSASRLIQENTMQFAQDNTQENAIPRLDIDPFSEEFLTDPYPYHVELRDAGPVVWLEKYGIWAVARHEQVHAVMTDWQNFISSAGVGLANFRTEKPLDRKSVVEGKRVQLIRARHRKDN